MTTVEMWVIEQCLEDVVEMMMELVRRERGEGERERKKEIKKLLQYMHVHIHPYMCPSYRGVPIREVA